MTVNQLQYHANREIARSNLAKERETERSNLAKEAEASRHNREMETIGKVKLGADYLSAAGSAIKGVGSFF